MYLKLDLFDKQSKIQVLSLQEDIIQKTIESFTSKNLKIFAWKLLKRSKYLIG